ncbi:helix-turn-helix domain-containing protein [Rhodococcus sp. IC4_135]|uniref:excisionase family DNA-binding protein n=1 Tax=Rhodococcus sp. IC4_135 TaxID=2715537 RepID=UPI00142482F5|nr:helix-turn-helix domain-containing protein [Rhodococcus sp. IC4_135]
MPNLEQCKTAAQAAERLRITPRAVLQAIARGAMKAEKLPGRTGAYLIPNEEIEKYATTRHGAE